MKILSLIFLLFVVNVHAQLNLPLKFQEDVVKWSELMWIDGNTKRDQIFDNRVAPIIMDDTLYVFMNYKGGINQSLGNSGYSIKKINKITGDVYWELLRTYKSYANRKAISRPTLSDGALSVTLYDEGLPGTGGTYWDKCYPAHIIIDSHNGIVIDSNFVNYKDTSLPKFQFFPEPGGLSTIPEPRFYLTTNGYLQRKYDIFTNAFIDTKIGFNGKIEKVDTSQSITTKYNLYDIEYIESENNNISVFSVSMKNNWVNKEMKLLKFDNNLNIIDSIDVTKYYTTDSIGYFNIIGDNGYILTVIGFEDFTLKTLKFTFHLFDSDGNFKDQLTYTLRDGIDNGIVYGWLHPIIDVVNERILLTQSRQNVLSESSFYEIFVSEGDTVRNIKHIEVEGTKDHFRTKYGTMMDNGDILLYLEQFTDPSADAVRLYSWMMLDGAKMNIISSTKEEIAARQLKIYPNPTSGRVTIDGLSTSAMVKIYNLSGILQKYMTIYDGDVDIRDLTPGIYVFDITNEDISTRHKVVKIE